MNRNGYCCDQPPDAPCEVGTPPPLVGVFEVSLGPIRVEDLAPTALPLPRRDGYYPGILGVSWSIVPDVNPGTPLAAPLIPVRLAFQALDDANLPVVGAAQYVLLDSTVRFFTIFSDGERSLVPPFVGGGANPFGLVISYSNGGQGDGTLRCFFRWMPRTNAYPGNVRPG